MSPAALIAAASVAGICAAAVIYAAMFWRDR